MMEHLFPLRLWTAALIASGGTLTSDVIDQSALIRVEGLELKATSVAGAADVKIEYAEVDDAGNVTGFDSHTDILASSAAQTNPEQMHAIAFPTVVSRRFKLLVTELASLADTLVTLNLICRESIKS